MLCQQTGLKTLRRSSQQAVSQDTAVIVADTLGELYVAWDRVSRCW